MFLLRFILPSRQSIVTTEKVSNRHCINCNSGSNVPITTLNGVRFAHSQSALPRYRRKEIAKEAAAFTRKMLKFAEQYDPMRTARLSVAQTIKRMGWEINSNEMISDGLYVDFTMKESYCCIEIVDSKNLVEKNAPNASKIPCIPPPLRDAKGDIILPLNSPYPSAPPAWSCSAWGKFFDFETANRHELIKSKGWKLIAVPQPWWYAATQAPNQHYARRDLLMSLVLPQIPFENRPTSAQAAVVQETSFKDSRRGIGAAAGRRSSTETATKVNSNKRKVRKATITKAEREEEVRRRTALLGDESE
jgi:hypothetical protein